MRNQLIGGGALLGAMALAACGSGSKGTTGTAATTGGHAGSGHGGSTSSAGGAGPGGATGSAGGATVGTGGSTSAAWTAVALVDEMVAGNAVAHGDDTVTAIWFKDASHGVVATYAAAGGTAGSLQSLSSPTKVDKVALTGAGTGFSGQNNDFIALFPTPAGLAAASTFGNQFITSADNGLTFKVGEKGDSNSGNIPAIWISGDSASKWHWLDDVGNVWLASSAPSAATSWHVTYQTGGSTPVPDPLPPGDCANVFHQGYFAFDSQQVAYVSPDGQTMMYGNGDGTVPAGVCRSTDGGNNFVPVDFPSPPPGSSALLPYVITFSDAMHGVAARGNDLEDGAQYIYATADGGKTWTSSTVPSSVTAAGAHAYFSGGFWAPDGQHVWIVGGTIVSDAKGLLLKSSDAGKTWSDVSSKFAGLPQATNKLHTGFALDAKNIWIGGEHGAFLHSGTGGE